MNDVIEMTEERRRAVVREQCRNAGLPLDGLDEPVADAPSAALALSPPLPPSMRPSENALVPKSPDYIRSVYDREAQSQRQRRPESDTAGGERPRDTGADLDLFAELTELIFRGADVLRQTRGRGHDALRAKVLEALDYCYANVCPQAAFVENLRAAVEQAESGLV